MIAIVVHVETAFVRRAAHGVNPTGGVGMFVDEGNLGTQFGIGAEKRSRRHAIDIRDGFETFDPADDLSDGDVGVALRLEAVIHHVAQHSRGKFRQADAPGIIRLAREPAVRARIEKIHRQVRDEMRTLVEQSCWLGGIHARDATGGPLEFKLQLELESKLQLVRRSPHGGTLKRELQLKLKLGLQRRTPTKILACPALPRSNPVVIYFDHNATTPLLPEARQAWLEAGVKFPGNPSSPHRLGARADHALNEAREKLAVFLGGHATEIVFTSGATESNNTALHHVARTKPADAEVWVSAAEHPCVLEPAQFYFGDKLRLIPVSRDGTVDMDWLEREFRRKRPALVAVLAANNETGALQPWEEINQLCHVHQTPFLCDAAQWLGKLPARGLGDCDWVTGAAHKFGGPRGVGFLKVPASLSVVPLIRGGPQEELRRAGTENVAGVLAMLAALEVRESQIARAEYGARAVYREAFERQLLVALPGVEIVSAQARRLWNTVTAFMPEADCQQRWVVKLDKLGVAVSTGSACSSGQEEASHVLRAMGRADDAGRVLRFSAGWETTEAEWRALLVALRSVGENIPPRPGKKLAKRSVRV